MQCNIHEARNTILEQVLFFLRVPYWTLRCLCCVRFHASNFHCFVLRVYGWKLGFSLTYHSLNACTRATRYCLHCYFNLYKPQNQLQSGSQFDANHYDVAADAAAQNTVSRLNDYTLYCSTVLCLSAFIPLVIIHGVQLLSVRISVE